MDRGKDAAVFTQWRGVAVADEEPIQGLREYLRAHPPKGFKPIPSRNVIANQIEWYFSNEDAYAESVYVDGVHVGTLLRSFKTKEVVGVKIFEEAIK